MMMSVSALAGAYDGWKTLSLPGIHCHFSVPGDMDVMKGEDGDTQLYYG